MILRPDQWDIEPPPPSEPGDIAEIAQPPRREAGSA
jgi:hypothetical protein